MPEVQNPPLTFNLVVSVLLVASGTCGYLLFRRWIRRRTNLSTEGRRHWLVVARNVASTATAFVLILLWAAHLRTVALSLVAIGVALVIATKEVILCFLGGLLRAGARPFNLGDWIDWADTRGEVIDVGYLSTKLLERRPGAEEPTGRVIALPNALLFSHVVRNERFTAPYRIHTVAVPVAAAADVETAAARLRAAAEEALGGEVESARAHFRALAEHEGLELPDPEPSVSIEPNALDRIDLHVRFAVARGRARAAEQDLLRRYFRAMRADGAGQAPPPA